MPAKAKRRVISRAVLWGIATALLLGGVIGTVCWGIHLLRAEYSRRKAAENAEIRSFTRELDRLRMEPMVITYMSGAYGIDAPVQIPSGDDSRMLVDALIRKFKEVHRDNLSSNSPSYRIRIGDTPSTTSIELASSPTYVRTDSLGDGWFVSADSASAAICAVLYLYYGKDVLQDKAFEIAFLHASSALRSLGYNPEPELTPEERERLLRMIPVVQERYNTIPDVRSDLDLKLP